MLLFEFYNLDQEVVSINRWRHRWRHHRETRAEVEFSLRWFFEFFHFLLKLKKENFENPISSKAILGVTFFLIWFTEYKNQLLKINFLEDHRCLHLVSCASITRMWRHQETIFNSPQRRATSCILAVPKRRQICSKESKSVFG